MAGRVDRCHLATWHDNKLPSLVRMSVGTGTNSVAEFQACPDFGGLKHTECRRPVGGPSIYTCYLVTVPTISL